MYYNYESLPRSLYIHWPFCPYKCHFCNFVALASHDQYMQQYHEALCKEIELFFSNYNQKLPIETVYLGGGTPSTYPHNLLLDTFDTLKKNVLFVSDAEVTIEVNPGTIRQEHIATWQKAGINRISIGVQSLNSIILKKLNRHQENDDVLYALSLLDQHFDNISVDLIIGLPGISSDEWKALLQQVVQWPIKHISMYFLMVHENTPLYFGVKNNTIQLPCDDSVVDLYYWSIDYLRDYGFEQYEISNFARFGYQSKHNKVYWQRKPFKGFGLGACSFDGIMRFAHEKNLMKYLHAIAQTQSIIAIEENLTREQIWLEKIMLGLRQIQGVHLSELMEELDIEQQKILHKNIQDFIDAQILSKQDDTIRLTPSALAIENEVILKLTPHSGYNV